MRSPRLRTDEPGHPFRSGPQLGFLVATLTAFAACSGLIVAIPAEAVLPAMATLLMMFAAGFAVVAWGRGSEDPNQVTYADVAGALTLIGLFAASTIDPDQLVRIVTTPSSQT